MISARVIAVALVLAVLGVQPAAAYKVDSKALMYAEEENASGYRLLTSIEPASDDGVPICNITFYPESNIQGGLFLSYNEEEGPWLEAKNSTLMVRASIPLKP